VTAIVRVLNDTRDRMIIGRPPPRICLRLPVTSQYTPGRRPLRLRVAFLGNCSSRKLTSPFWRACFPIPDSLCTILKEIESANTVCLWPPELVWGPTKSLRPSARVEWARCIDPCSDQRAAPTRFEQSGLARREKATVASSITHDR
jgi:hypothetical protein